MKKFFLFIIAFMALASPMIAKESDGTSTSVPVAMDIHPIINKPNHPIHRAPVHICVEAWYNAEHGTISINYYGEIPGEVNLYCDGMLVATAPEINTTFVIGESGYYTLEIVTESWTAIGSIEI